MNQAAQINQTQYISLSALRPSKRNVRTASTDKKSDAELIASIEAHGLLQNLIAIPSPEFPGEYEVVAGGRRLTALLRLRDEGKITNDYQVPCIERSVEDATDISISENVHAQLHPADRFIAFKKLADEGKSQKEIARTHGVSTGEVKKLLKLGSVAPELIQKFRDEKMDLNCVMAFTISDDHERQIAAYNHCKNNGLWAGNIRHFLTDKTVKSDDPRAQFVTLTAYKKAGGTATNDLFGAHSYLHDEALLNELAELKFSTLAEPLTSDWAWAEGSLKQTYEATKDYIQIDGAPGKAPTELLEERKTINSRMDELEGENGEDDEEEEWDRLTDRLYEIEEHIDNLREYTPEQKQIAGVLITLNHDGKPQYHEGLVRKEDLPKLKALTQSDDAHEHTIDAEVLEHNLEQYEKTHNEDGTKKEEPSESGKLKEELSSVYNHAFQADLISNDKTTINGYSKTALCSDLLIFSLALQIFNRASYWRQLLNLSVTLPTMETLCDKAAETLEKFRLSLSLDWLTQESTEQQFLHYQDLPTPEKLKIMRYCVASLTATSVNHPGDLQKAVRDQTLFIINDYWQPTADNYFSRIKLEPLKAIAQEIGGDEFAEKHQKTKRKDLATAIEALPASKDWTPPFFSEAQ